MRVICACCFLIAGSVIAQSTTQSGSKGEAQNAAKGAAPSAGHDTPQGAAQAAACVIRVDTAGPIHAGMTIRAARLALPGTVFKQTDEVGGGSIAFFAVTRASNRIMDLYPNQEDGIKETSKVELIRVYDPSCATVEGVHPGMPLIAVEGKFGNLKKLIVEQSEMCEYAQFDKLPSWLEIQVGRGDAGIYDPGQLCTQRYKAAAAVESLWVSHPLKNNLLNDDQFCKAAEKKF
jgi:hypothetical protein